jgi:AraC family transcriptional regulator
MKESSPSHLDAVNQVLHLVEDTLGLAPGDSPPSLVDALKALKYELFRAAAAGPLPTPSDPAFAPSRFTIVFEHIEDNLESGVNLIDLASLMALSVSHFSHAFKAAFGVAPYRYILQRRISVAKALLRNSDSTVAAIAARVGFSSQSRFSQIFAQMTGITPSAYRDHGTLRGHEDTSAGDLPLERRTA